MTDQGQSVCDEGIAAFREGRTEDAIRLLSQAIAEDPRNQRAYLILGAAHVKRNEFDDAIAAFERAREIRPDQAHVHYNLGLVYQRAGRPQDALTAFRAALEVDPSYEKARQALDRAGVRPAEAAPAAGPPATSAVGPPRQPAEGSQPVATFEPEVQAMTEPPVAPWQTSTADASADTKSSDNLFELRPLGGAAPAKPSEPQSRGGAEAPAEPPKAPWEMEGMQVRTSGRAAPAKQGPPSSRPGQQHIVRPGQPPRPAKEPSRSEYATGGAVMGALCGAGFLVALTVVDRFLGVDWSITRRAGTFGWVPAIIGAGIAGAVLGAVIGAVTAYAGTVNAGIYTSIGIWIFMALILVMRAGARGAPLIIGIVMGTVDGALMGFVVGSQVLTSVKRK